MEREQARKTIEALLYMADHPLPETEISEVIELKAYDPQEVRNIITEISQKLESDGSALRVVEVAGGFQMATQPDMAPAIRKLYKERLTVRLSPSSLETLAIIAYKQPIARGDIEQIRGVEVGGVMETLLERRLIKVVGRKETIGRPLLYGTTPHFLKHFGLKHLAELPDLNSLPLSEALGGTSIPVSDVTPEEITTDSVDSAQELTEVPVVATEPETIVPEEIKTDA
ncbi:MAG: SMC-Scp complex subunit ScpB [Elusimicrobiota bacterium]